MIEQHMDIPGADGAMNSFVVCPEEGGPPEARRHLPPGSGRAALGAAVRPVQADAAGMRAALPGFPALKISRSHA